MATNPGNGSSSPFVMNPTSKGNNFVTDPSGSSAGQGHDFIKDPSSPNGSPPRDFLRESRTQEQGGPEVNEQSVPSGGKMPFGDPKKGPRAELLGTFAGDAQRKPFTVKDAVPANVAVSGSLGAPGDGAADAGSLPVGSLEEV